MQAEKTGETEKTTTISDSFATIKQDVSCPGNVTKVTNDDTELLIIEPFYGGSHKQLIDSLLKHIRKHHLVTLSAKKWHWRARCSALIVANMIPKPTKSRILFCSSTLSLAELIGIRQDLASLKKIVYFHENQMVYPVRHVKDRDVQFAYNQITTCLAADLIVFNSFYNKESFLSNIKSVVKLLPDKRPRGIREKIEPRCRVLYFPVEFPARIPDLRPSDFILRIVWPHRWEFDKNPDLFIRTLLKLKDDGLKFRVSFLGEGFTEVPAVLIQVKEKLKDEIVHYGFVESRSEYYKVLQTSHVVVSTAEHEFFGVSVLEAAYCGCFPLVPRKLVYPEIYPECCLYSSEDELHCRLKEFCLNPALALKNRSEMALDFNKYALGSLLPKYKELLGAT